jgi:hypothetical protein
MIPEGRIENAGIRPAAASRWCSVGTDSGGRRGCRRRSGSLSPINLNGTDRCIRCAIMWIVIVHIYRWLIRASRQISG